MPSPGPPAVGSGHCRSISSWREPPSAATIRWADPRVGAALIRAALAALALAACAEPSPPARVVAPEGRFYLAPRRGGPIQVDGRLDEEAWSAAPWSESFVDIEGAARPIPPLATRVRMLWDDSLWYVGAELEEPDLWATITTRDSVIYLDNDFELFVDPDGDTHQYFELEINALGTVWDLLLPKPYRDGGEARNGWNISGLASAVALDGTLNDPSDRDRRWTVELAIPWFAFRDGGATTLPPRPADRWQVNFSRVQWHLEVVDGQYRKRVDSTTGRPPAEDNWVWSPQGAVNMHMPEMWGTVQFGGLPATGEDSVRLARDHQTRWALRQVYYAERRLKEQTGEYTADLSQLELDHVPPGLVLELAPDGWQASAPADDVGTRWHIRPDGRVWLQ
jgi:hypothetical protein